MNSQQIQSEKTQNDQFTFKSGTWQWACHRGLRVYVSVNDSMLADRCFCPQNYYGDYCEYENERVSLTLRLLPIDRHSLFTFVVKLIDENSEINSFEQFTFTTAWGCSKKFNMYLLYATRPKDLLKNYSIHIDAFDKYTMTYHTSWYLSIPFIFLPVNRIVANLIIPYENSQSLKTCQLPCKNGGQCMKYTNMDKSFCFCNSNWTGKYCHTPLDCNDCSNDSLCVGSFNNRSICVCPQSKVGPRCLIPGGCRPNYCENNGQCVALNYGIEDTDIFVSVPNIIMTSNVLLENKH